MDHSDSTKTGNTPWRIRGVAPVARSVVMRFALGLLICNFVWPLWAQEKKPAPVTQTATPAVRKANWKFTDVAGKDHDPFADKSVKAVVIVFIATECPIANYYQPTINRLAKSYQNKGVRFLLFHPDPDITASKAKEHAKAFKIDSPVFADANFALAKRLKATSTPEAFVIGRDGTTKYRGRIDDMYVAFGKRRRAPTTNDLKDALDAVLAGKTVAKRATKPIGCYIPFGLKEK